MGRSISAYIRHAADVRTVRQIHAITTAIGEDPHASLRLKSASAALARKLEQVIRLPIASAPFLASIWRDFRALKTVLQEEDCELAAVRSTVKRQLNSRQLRREKGEPTPLPVKTEGQVFNEKG
jgi:aminoglycoside phosphotransferase